MLFNSLSFAIFLPLVFALYWFAFGRDYRRQNVLILLSSYVFYGWWDWRFLFLLAFSTFLDYFTGIKMEEARSLRLRKFWFWLSVSVNLGFLGFFKYYNFFAESFAEMASGFGLQVNPWTLRVLLPVGISFYTFHGLSYVIDIYNQKIKAERNFTDYAVFVSFFPLLVAGPIERATHLLPQIKVKRTFNYANAIDGLRQIFWGLFKKIVIADQCAEFANIIFNDYQHQSGSTLVLGALFFTFQIYGDFSGYSDIALGTARLFGFELLRNFAFPYFSRDIAEFWRRWHISLSSWFKDYLYIPLGGSKVGKWTKVRNTFIIFLVSGFWHGANWTFIAWGFLNALYIMPSIVLGSNRNHLDIVAEGRKLPTLRELLSMVVTFSLTVFAWIFFRSDSLGDALHYVGRMFSRSLLTVPQLKPVTALFFVCVLLGVEWLGREKKYALERLEHGITSVYVRWAFYGIGLLLIYYYANANENQQFIYFQF